MSVVILFIWNNYFVAPLPTLICVGVLKPRILPNLCNTTGTSSYMTYKLVTTNINSSLKLKTRGNDFETFSTRGHEFQKLTYLYGYEKIVYGYYDI